MSTLTNYWHLIDSGQQTCQYLSLTIMARQRSLSEISATLGTSGTPLFTGSTVLQSGQVKSTRTNTIPPQPPSVSLLCLSQFLSHHLVFPLTHTAASGTPSYFLSFCGCFLSIDLQPCILSALSLLELCLWAPKLQLIWRNHNIASVFSFQLAA